MGSKVQRVPMAHTAGGGITYPITGGAAHSLDIRPAAIAGLVELQVLGFSNDSITIQVPAIAAGATVDVPFTYNPQTLPVSFKLVPGSSGLIYVDIDFPTLPVDATGNVLCECGISKSLTFAIGSQSQPGTSAWTLTPVQQYQAPSIQGTVRFFAPTGTAATSVTFVAWSFLICKPPTVSG